MRLVRLAPQPSRVAEDIRAALASLGRGTEVAGGIALVGVRPLPSPHTYDAVVVLPGGVLIVQGVDLPEPVMKLEAPLTGPWKADGWPLEAPGDEVNPAGRKLELAKSLRKHLSPTGVTVGTVLAVGPFVDHVDQPAADMAGMVRVLYPTATSMLAASVSLASPRPCTIDDAKTLIKMIAPDAPGITPELLASEGFPRDTPTITLPKVPAEEKPKPKPPPPPAPIEVTAPVPRVTAAAPVRVPAPSRPPKPSKTVRWLPFGAIGLLAVLLVTAIVLASTSGESAPATTAATPTQAALVVEGIPFTQRAEASDAECASHAFGDAQASLQQSGCVAIRRVSFEADVDGKMAAVSMAVITFANETAAGEFKKVVDNPGGGGVTDLATETGKWPRTPNFDGAAYYSTVRGGVVRMVLAAWFDKPSSTADPDLQRVTKAAAAMPLS